MIDQSRRRVWSRKDVDVLAEEDEPEGSHVMFRVAMTPRLLLLLMEYQETRGSERVELVSVGPDERDVALKFFYRDRVEEASDGRG